MAKKKVDVDEHMLKNIMVGDIPVFGREIHKYPERETVETDESEVVLEESVDSVATKANVFKQRKKREEPFSYKEKYLVNIPASNRSHVYINREVADCIKRVLPVIAPDMSISGYISNILVMFLKRKLQF